MSGRSPQPSNPRLVDVARVAGVSRATASRALAGYGRVSEQTINHVRQVASELGYRPDLIAQAMRSGRTGTIGLITADVSGSFFGQTTLSIIREAALHEFNTLVLSTDENLDNEKNAVRVLLDKKVDGLIVVTATRNGHSHLMRDGELVAPLVFLDRRADDVNACVVSTDDRRAAIACVEILRRQHHTRIGFMTASSTVSGHLLSHKSTQAISTVVDRTEGWLQGMDEAGISVRPEWLAFTDQDHEAAERAAIGMLSQPDRPTAIVAGNSEVALAIIAACRHLDIPLPEGLSLICFDDPSWAGLITPALTVVSRPVHELGSQAVNLLLAQIHREQVNPESLTLTSEIVMRDSITPPAA